MATKYYKSVLSYKAPPDGFGTGVRDFPYQCFLDYRINIEIIYEGDDNIVLFFDDYGHYFKDEDKPPQVFNINIGTSDNSPLSGHLTINRTTEIVGIEGIIGFDDFIAQVNLREDTNFTTIDEVANYLYPPVETDEEVIGRVGSTDYYGSRWQSLHRLEQRPFMWSQDDNYAWYYLGLNSSGEVEIYNGKEKLYADYLRPSYGLAWDTNIYTIKRTAFEESDDPQAVERYQFEGIESTDPDIKLPNKGDVGDTTGDNPDDWKKDNADDDSNESIVNPVDTPLNCGGAMNNYVISSERCDGLFQWFWNGMIEQARTDNLLEYLTGVFGDMGQCLTALTMYPFTVPTGDATTMVLGRYDSGISMNKLSTTTNMLYECSYKVPRKNENFLDYAPYTRLMLYLPYVGIKELDVNVFMGHTIKIRYFIDYTSGGVDVHVQRDNFVIDIFSGKAGADVPYSLDGGKGLRDKIIDTAITSGVTVGGALVGGAIAGPVGMVAGAGAGEVASSVVSDVTGLAKEGMQNATGSHYASIPSNANVMNAPFKIQLWQIYPDYYKDDKYGETNGFVFMKHKKLDNIKGYTVCQNVKMSFGKTETSDNVVINPSDEEQREIKMLLESGVYL